MSLGEAASMLSPRGAHANNPTPGLHTLDQAQARSSNALEEAVDIVGEEFADAQVQLDRVRSYLADRLEGVAPEPLSPSPEPQRAEGVAVAPGEPDYARMGLDDLQAEEALLVATIEKSLRLAKDLERKAEEQEVVNGERKAVESILLT